MPTSQLHDFIEYLPPAEGIIVSYLFKRYCDDCRTNMPFTLGFASKQATTFRLSFSISQQIIVQSVT